MAERLGPPPKKVDERFDNWVFRLWKRAYGALASGDIGVTAPITVTTSGTGTLNIGHGTSGAISGTYGNGGNVSRVVVDTYGHVTSATNVAISTAPGSFTVKDGLSVGLNATPPAAGVIFLSRSGASAAIVLQENGTSQSQVRSVGVNTLGITDGAGSISRFNINSTNGVFQFTGTGTFGGAYVSTNTVHAGVSGAIPGTYGDSSNVGQFVVNTYGHITSATNVAIAASTSAENFFITGSDGSLNFNGQGNKVINFYNTAGSLVSGSAGGFFLVSGDNNWYLDNYQDGNLVWRGSGASPTPRGTYGFGNGNLSLAGTLAAAAGTISGATTLGGNVTYSADNLGINLTGTGYKRFLIDNAAGTFSEGNYGAQIYLLNVNNDTYIDNYHNGKLYLRGTSAVIYGTYEFGGGNLTLAGTLAAAAGTFSGNVTASGTLNPGANIVTDAQTFQQQFLRTLSTNTNEHVELGTYGFPNGAGFIQADVVVGVSGYSSSKSYIIPIQYQPSAGTYVLSPVVENAPYSSNQYQLEVVQSLSNNTLRLRSLGGATAGTANISIRYPPRIQGVPSTFNVSTATGTSPVATVYDMNFRPSIPQVIKNGNYTLTAREANQHIYREGTATGVATWTIPANSSVNFRIGTPITLINDGTGNVTLAITSDTLVFAGTGATGSRTIPQYGMATILKVASTRWVVSGAGVY